MTILMTAPSRPSSTEMCTERPCQAPKTEDRFTLIELLVVVAIIGILFSVLLPALTQAKETAKAITCTNTQKQLGMAITEVSQDSNHGYWLPYRDPARDQVGHERYTPLNRDRYWTEMIRIEYYGGKPSNYGLSDNEPWRFDQADNEATGGKNLICVSDSLYHEATPTTDWYWVHSDSFTKYSSYGLNWRAFGLEFGAAIKLGDLIHPSKTLVLTESDNIHSCRCTPGNALGLDTQHGIYSSTAMARHLGKLNSLFADCHVELTKVQDIYHPYNEETPTEDQRLMWYGK